MQSALKPRCIGCSNCVLACPFGVPKYIAEFDQMMKCDMCTDRTSEGYAPMCASVCPSEALWYGTVEEFHETRTGSLRRRLALRPPSRCAPRCTRSSTTSPPARSTCSPGRPARGSTIRSDSKRRDDADDRTAARAAPIWKRDFPYEAAAEEEVTRREFARYLVAGAGRHGRRQRRPRRVDPAPHHQHRRTPRDRRARRRRRRRHLPVPVPDRRTTPPSSLRLGDREVVAFSQKCTHLGCVVFYEADENRWHCPCHEGNFDSRDRCRHLRAAAAPARPHRRRDPRRRHDLGARGGTT